MSSGPLPTTDESSAPYSTTSKGASVHILRPGYSTLCGTTMRANCSCVLITDGHVNVIVDTMTPWDKGIVIEELQKHNLTPDDIQYAVGTHGHSDHVGNLNLFTAATRHIVGYTISQKDEFFIHGFDAGKIYPLTPNIALHPTPGHVTEHVSVVVKCDDGRTMVIAGDLFEKEEDINDPSVWIQARSESVMLQYKNRLAMAKLADEIIPGHGPAFKVTDHYRQLLEQQLKTAQEEGIFSS